MTSPIRRGAPNSVDAPIQTKNAEHAALTTLSSAEQMLDAARNLDDIKKIVDIAEAARVYARAAKIGESAAQHAEEIKLKAQRKAGEFLAQVEKGKGGRPRENSNQAGLSLSPFRQLVEDAGLDNHEVVRFQRVAAVPELQFRAYLEEKKTAGGEITQAELLRTAEQKIRRARRMENIMALSSPDLPDRKYPVLLVDPPWRYEYAESDSRAIENQYPTMSLEGLCALDIPKISLDDALMFMWATTPKLVEAIQLLKAWGFTYRTHMVWVKDKIGMGYYIRSQHEDLLIAKRGELPVPEAFARPSSVIEAPRLAHSAKPLVIYDLLDQMYPGLQKIELFARGAAARKDWSVWGDQATQTAETECAATS